MTIRAKLAAVFLSLLLLQAVGALIAIQGAKGIEHSLRQIAESSLKEAEALAKVEEALDALHASVMSRSMPGGPADSWHATREGSTSVHSLRMQLLTSVQTLRVATTHGRDLARLSDDLGEASEEAGELESIDALRASIAPMYAHLGEYERLLARGDSTAAAQLARQRILPLFDGEVIPRARALRADSLEEIRDETLQASEVIEAADEVVLLTALCLLAVAAALSYAATRNILRPIEALATAAQEVRSGNLSHRVRYDVSDEFGDLAATFDEMATSLEQQQEQQRQVHMAVSKSEQSLAITLQSIGDGVISTDAEGRVVRLNGVGEALTGWSEAEARGRPIEEVFHIVHEETRAPITIPVTETLATGKVCELANHTLLLERDGAEHPIADSCAPIRDKDQRVVGAVLVFRDMGDERRVQEAMEAARERQSFLLSATNAVLYTCEPVPNYDVTFISPNIRDTLGHEPEEFLVPGFWHDKVHPDDIENVFAEFDSLFTEGALHHEYRVRHKDGSWRWMNNYLQLVHDEAGELVELVGSFHDNTERHRERAEAEARLLQANEGLEGLVAERSGELQKTEQLLQDTQRLAHIGSFRRRLATGATWWSAETYRIFGLDEASFEGNHIDTFRAAIHPEDRERMGERIARAEAEGTGLVEEFRIVRVDEQVRHLAIVAERATEPGGHGAWLQGAVQDITDRVHVQDALRHSLQDKELLLREIHHRVKNNLQIISSLLAMQSDATDDSSTQRALQEGMHRVRSMALIHERLYQSTTLARIDFGEYAKALSGFLFRSYRPAPSVQLNIETERIDLNIETAVPCGLILNELVSNALKHAFGDGGGQLDVGVRVTPHGKICLSVRDTGPGLPPDFEPARSKSLGMLLVTSLTKQIKGTLAITNDGGACFEVVFEELVPHGPE